MHALLYRSRARPGLLAGDLNAIIETAESRNRAIDVTGILLYGQLAIVAGAPGEFVQWLEGPEDAVEALYADIRTDARHFDPDVIARGPVADIAAGSGCRVSGGRLFPAWSMRLVRLSELPATPQGFLSFVRDMEHRLEAA